MKVITISDELPTYRLCTACRSDNDVREITFAYDNGAFRQGTQITLCKECRKDLVEVLTETDEPQGEWIPCSERLPEIGQKVLASTKKTVFTQVFKGYYSEPKIWVWENNSVKTIEAWQPLPKAWEGEDDEKSV